MRLAILTNFIAPYRLPLFQLIAEKVDHLKIFVSAGMEPNRKWAINWGTLDVKIQKTFTVKRVSKNWMGYKDERYIHIPFSTLPDLMQYHPDAIISAEFGVRTLGSLIYKQFHPSCKLVAWATLSEHSERKRGRIRMKLRKFILDRIDAVIVNGSSGQRYIQEYKIPCSKIFIVPQTTDISLFLQNALPNFEKKRLLYVGRLIEGKGLVPFLTAFSEWMENHPEEIADFIICGDGPLRSTILDYSPPKNLTIRWLGEVPYSEIPDIFRLGNIFVFPTLSDEWGLVINEAMASGLPVLGSMYSQAVEDLIEEDRTGWTFYTDRPDDIYSAISRAMSLSPEVFKEFGTMARERIVKLNIDYIAYQILDVLNSKI